MEVCKLPTSPCFLSRLNPLSETNLNPADATPGFCTARGELRRCWRAFCHGGPKAPKSRPEPPEGPGPPGFPEWREVDTAAAMKRFQETAGCQRAVVLGWLRSFSGTGKRNQSVHLYSTHKVRDALQRRQSDGGIVGQVLKQLPMQDGGPWSFQGQSSREPPRGLQHVVVLVQVRIKSWDV